MKTVSIVFENTLKKVNLKEKKILFFDTKYISIKKGQKVHNMYIVKTKRKQESYNTITLYNRYYGS